MVDVSHKEATAREAVAEGRITMSPQTLAAAMSGEGPKGAVGAVAELAGIMAAKRTADLIPLCHSLPLSSVDVAIEPLKDQSGLRVTATAATIASTGVEMEALTAACVALLTLYDMLKASGDRMSIDRVRLVSKTGGGFGNRKAHTP